MSERKWTPEPWTHIDRFGFQGADLSRVDLLDPNNGDRVEACVNALAGIPDPSAFVATARADAARVRELEETLKLIADAPACGPDGSLYYEFQSEDGQVGCMHVDPLGWIGDASSKARSSLTRKPAQEGAGG